MYGKGCSDAKNVNLPGWKGFMSKMEVAGREEWKRTRGRYVNKDRRNGGFSRPKRGKTWGPHYFFP